MNIIPNHFQNREEINKYYKNYFRIQWDPPNQFTNYNKINKF